jgi:HEXXH motif-containing protein
MRERLGESLRYIAQQVESRLDFSPQAIEEFLGRLARAPVSPQAFGAYCDLVLALDADDLPGAQRYLAEIVASPNHPGGPEVMAFRDPGHDRASDRYARLIDADPSMPFRIYAPPPGVAAAAREHVAGAFEILERGYAPLAEEIRALLREIVLAVGPDDPQAVDFDGASSYMLWGGIVLNARSYTTPTDMVQALVHESGHNLLFGLCSDDSLIENDDAERYASPLRRDPRPMDGIVHATYVSARVHDALARLLESGRLTADEARIARKALPAHERAFMSGLETVEQHARLTRLGRDVMAGARARMAA